MRCSATASTPAEIAELTGGGAHVSIDAVGSAGTSTDAVNSLRRRGRHVQIGLLAADQLPVLPLDRILAWELDVLGSHGMAAADYPGMLDLVARGKLRPQDLPRRDRHARGGRRTASAAGSGHGERDHRRAPVRPRGRIDTCTSSTSPRQTLLPLGPLWSSRRSRRASPCSTTACAPGSGRSASPLRESRDYDAELLYVAALLHDIGLTEAFDNYTLAFEDASGHAADALTAGAGWPAERRIRVREVIQRHNWPSVDPAMDVEGYLLEIATALDIAGARADALPLDFQEEVLAAYPRLDLAAEFGASVADQALRKPTTAAARLIDGGMVRKLAENPLEQRGD